MVQLTAVMAGSAVSYGLHSGLPVSFQSVNRPKVHTTKLMVLNKACERTNLQAKITT